MKSFIRKCLLAALLFPSMQAALAGPSVYRSAPQDAQAITVKAKGDGKADDTASIQAAIDAAEHKGAGGIVFLPAGRYRISKTLMLWPAVRVIGVGATRPVLVLADKTPGFQQGVKHMVIFTGRGSDAKGRVPFPPPGSVPYRDDIADANSGTFYSAMENIDIEIGKGNEGAAAIRFHAAQHAYLRHMDFNLGSAFAGIYQTGNEAEDLHFKGGRYGIVSEKTSDAWQFSLIDSSFEGQRDAAIREHEAGLTLLNVSIKNTKVGIEINEGNSDWLWGSKVRFENISRAAVLIANEASVYTQVGLMESVARNTPVLAQYRTSGGKVQQTASSYRIEEFTYGLTLPTLGAMGTTTMRSSIAPLQTFPKESAPIMRKLPKVAEWVNVQTLGAKGDGKTDDTAALKAAIAQHKVLYFPSGFYKITDTLLLKPDTQLIGLHPSTTQIVVPDETPAFHGVGTPTAMIEAPKGGNNLVHGLGLFAGGINMRATNVLWQAGENSQLDDVKILGGHGTQLQDGTRFNPYDAMHAADPDARKRWDAQYPSIWVSNGGGGKFVNLWTANTYSQAGFTVSDTTTSGLVISISNEHHGRAEFVLNRAANWQFLAPQTEEEVGESQDALSFDIRNSCNILLANYHGYRVTRGIKPAPMAVRVENSSDLRFRNVHVNAESGLAACDANGCGTYLRASKYPYENAIVDITRKREVREREFAVVDITDTMEPPPALMTRKPIKLAGDFFSIAGGAVDASGKLWFIDRKFQRIHGYDSKQGLTLERETTLDPINLAVDDSGALLVLSMWGSEGTVYAFKPGAPETELTVIAPTPLASTSKARVLLPVNWWVNGEFMDRYDAAKDHFATMNELFTQEVGKPKAREYVSPDGSLVLPAFRVFQQGPPTHMGWRWSDALQSYGLVSGKVGERIYVSNASEGRTYSAVIAPGGALTDARVFAERGGESVAVDHEGSVYVANGQIFIYDKGGKQIGLIEVPERPLQLLVGGENKRTLYILSHHSLYSVQL